MKKLSRVKLVIFDLDGTLVDAYEAIFESFNYAMKTSGYPLQTKRIIRRAVGWGDRKLLEPFVLPCDLATVLETYRRHHEKSLLRGSRVFPDVKCMLGQLRKKGYTLAVASNRPTKFSRILLKHLGLARYFKAVLCADKLKKGKPHPEILQVLMRRFSVSPKETVYVGDMLIDAKAGRSAKVATVVVTTGSGTREELKNSGACRVLRNASFLTRLL